MEMTLQQLGVTLLVVMIPMSKQWIYAFCASQRHYTNAYSETCPAVQLVVLTHTHLVYTTLSNSQHVTCSIAVL